MALCRVFYHPDGRVVVNRPNPKLRQSNETEVAFVDRVCRQAQARDASLAGLPYINADTRDLPQNRTLRAKWRLQNGQVVVDVTVPDPPHPKQALLDAIDAATTLDQLKVLLKQVIRP